LPAVTRGRPTWTNWAGNQSCSPIGIERPTTEAELAAIVERAAAAGERVKAIGAGHSFTATACTDGHLVDLSDYGEVLWTDLEASQVCVQSGMRLAALNEHLALRGLALENLGDIAYQSVAGATQTATHGTGARFRNISAAIVGLRLIVGDGSILECTPQANADVLETARVGVGALGVLSTVTLQCVPAFNLHAVEDAMPVDDVLADLDTHVDTTDHFEFFWIPNTRWALTKHNRRTTDPVDARSRLSSFRDDILINNLGFEAVMKIGAWRNNWLPKAAKRLPSTGRVEYTDASHRVFASPRLVRFYEMEYAIPRVALVDALTRVRELVDRQGRYIGFPVEVRFVAADDIPLSPASGRETAYVAVHVYRGTPYDQYFQGVEAIMNDYEGRPHWGKMHFQTASTLAPRYPRWDDFLAMRSRLDPAGTFANSYLDRVLGPVGATS
jgi:FAD-linked oxidoreductase